MEKYDGGKKPIRLKHLAVGGAGRTYISTKTLAKRVTSLKHLAVGGAGRTAGESLLS